MRLLRALVLAAFALCASAAFAQTIKIGFITSYSGLNGNLGPYMERAVRLYVKLHEKELPPGVKIELLTRDDTGPNPDKARQLARQPVEEAGPDARKPSTQAGKTATAVMKSFAALGIAKAGLKLMGPGDITTDEELPNMGDIAIGVLPVRNYSAAAARPANKAFVAA